MPPDAALTDDAPAAVPRIDPKVVAESVRVLLAENVLRYRNFGAYWFLIKALLRRFYDAHALPFLAGSYSDLSVNARIPEGLSLQALLAEALDTYRHNAAFNLGRNEVEDDEGQRFRLYDPDIEG